MSKSSATTTSGRKKLEELGLMLPLLPVTSAGAFPKSPDLAEAREKVAQNVLPVSELRRKENIATDLWLRDQIRMDVDVHVDGEMNRSFPLEFFAEKIEGFEMGGLVRLFENHYVRKPIIKRKLSWKEPLNPLWQANQRATNRPLKAVLTGPLTLFDWSFNEFYGSREEGLTDLTSILRKELESLVEAGAKVVQIDEPALTGKPDHFDLVSRCLKDLTRGLKMYFILKQSYADMIPYWPSIESLPVDNFYFDGANSRLAILDALKKHPTKKDITLGVQDVLSFADTDEKDLETRIKAALKVIPAAQLWIAPDAGLHFLKIEEAAQELTALVAVAKKFRKKLNQSALGGG